MNGTCIQCPTNMETSDEYVLSYYEDVITVININYMRVEKETHNPSVIE